MLWHVEKNHALPDGNKRVALISTIVFAGMNGLSWTPPESDRPQFEGDLGGSETTNMMIGVAAGDIGVEQLRGWISDRLGLGRELQNRQIAAVAHDASESMHLPGSDSSALR